MPNAQNGIFEETSKFHLHMELGLTAGAGTASALASLRSEANSAGIHMVVGFGPTAWASLAGERATELAPLLAPFTEVSGVEGRFAPATQHDLWFWLHGGQPDDHFDLGREIRGRLGSDVRIDVPCFVYHDSRDLTGFIDGTENPKEDERQEVALIPQGEPGGGGSYGMTIKWIHDLDAFNALPVDEQERVIGRTKPDSVELAADVMPNDSHVARVVIDENGEELEIYRRSVPFGSVEEHGLFFVAFSADPHRFSAMLNAMFGVDDGIADRLTGFSKPVSGSFWYVPSIEVLETL